MIKNTIHKTQIFVKKAFQDNHDYSFNDWRVMYYHSLDVKNLVIKIANTINCDKELAAVAALLHDIGKTYRTKSKHVILHQHRLNYIVSKTFIQNLQLNKDRQRKLKEIVTYKSKSKEMKAVLDADALAFFKDQRLHSLYFKWAIEKNDTRGLRRHINKFNKLNFKISKKIGSLWYKKMMFEWSPHLKKIIKI